MRRPKFAWVRAKQARIKSKDNGGKKVMAAEFISIWGPGYLCMSDAEFLEARRAGAGRPL